MTALYEYFSVSEIGERRKALGLSLQEASEGICSASYLSLIESGKRSPSFKTLRALARKLGLLEIADSEGFSISPALLVAEAAWKAGADRNYLEAKKSVTNPNESEYLRLLELERSGTLATALEQVGQLLKSSEIEKSLKSRLLLFQTRLFRDSGNLLSAARSGELALIETSSAIENGARLAETQAMLSGIYCETGDLGRAKELVDSIEINETSQLWTSIVALWSKSLVYLNLGQLSVAQELANAAAQLVDQMNMPLIKARLIQNKIWIGLMHDSSVAPDAVDEIHWSQDKFREAQSELDLIYSLSTESLMMAKLGNFEEARNLSARSLNEAKKLDGADLSRLYAEAANVALLIGDSEDLQAKLLLARRALEDAGANRSAAVTWRNLAELFEQIGDQVSAIQCLKASADLLGIGSQILERPVFISD
jgi:transcriptional regulator with XRE-family HTH domain